MTAQVVAAGATHAQDAYCMKATHGSIAEYWGVFESFLKKHTRDVEYLAEWKLAFEEAAMNAIEHGSQLDATKDVHVSWHSTEFSIVLTFSDSGNGPASKLVENPMLPVDPYQVRGRGLYLIRHCCDNWAHSWTPTGYTLTLIKSHRRKGF